MSVMFRPAQQLEETPIFVTYAHIQRNFGTINAVSKLKHKSQEMSKGIRILLGLCSMTSLGTALPMESFVADLMEGIASTHN